MMRETEAHLLGSLPFFSKPQSMHSCWMRGRVSLASTSLPLPLSSKESTAGDMMIMIWSQAAVGVGGCSTPASMISLRWLLEGHRAVMWRSLSLLLPDCFVITPNDVLAEDGTCAVDAPAADWAADVGLADRGARVVRPASIPAQREGADTSQPRRVDHHLADPKC